MSKVVIPAAVEELARLTVHAALTVHRELGPGLLESAYQECLAVELQHEGLRVRREVALPLTYRDHLIAQAYRVDLLVNDQLLVETKAIEAIQPIHRVQVSTYLKLLKLPLGLLINFNTPLIKDGIHRILNLALRDAPFPSLQPSLRP
jgi:GxxExxY protein